MVRTRAPAHGTAQNLLSQPIHVVPQNRTDALHERSIGSTAPLKNSHNYIRFCCKSSQAGGSGCWTWRVGRAGTCENGSTAIACSTCVDTHTQRSRCVDIVFFSGRLMSAAVGSRSVSRLPHQVQVELVLSPKVGGPDTVLA